MRFCRLPSAVCRLNPMPDALFPIPDSRCPMPFKPAFTLLELLIAMTLIVVFMALVAPWLQRVRARNDLKSTAQSLQGELYKTRLTAMKSGEAYLFRYQSQTGVYEILPKKVYDALNPTLDSLDSQVTRSVGPPLNQGVLGTQGVQRSTGDDSLSTFVYRKSLPNRYTFGTVKPVLAPILNPDSTRSVGAPLISSLTPNLSEPEQPVWSEPIFFFPNGRTSNGSLEIYTLDDYRFQIELTLRGLTGTARLGEITSPEY